MYKYILESVDQINWLGIIPLVLFFTFFVLTSIRILRKDKGFIEKMSKLPLENDSV